MHSSGRYWIRHARDILVVATFSVAMVLVPHGPAQADGGGSCLVYDATRPRKCGEFPVGGAAIEVELATQGEVWLQTAAFARCSWSGICIVPDEDPRLT